MSLSAPSPRHRGRVVHLLASTRRRGAETHAVRLSAALAELGWVSSVVALERGGDLEVDFVGAGRFDPRSLRELSRRTRDADVIVAHGSSSLLAAYLVTRVSRVPFVYRSIGDPGHWVQAISRKARVRHLLRQASAVVALWPEARQRLIDQYSLAAERVAVIPNAVDASAFPPISEPERARARAQLRINDRDGVVAFIGALAPEKDPLAAVRVVADTGRNLELLIAGAGTLDRDVAALAERRLPGRFQLLGETSDVRAVLAASDVVLLTSRTEGVPGVLVEAGLAGMPAVATNVGGVSTVVVDGSTGFVVPLDGEGECRRALERALDERETLGRAAAAYCRDHFDFDRAVAQWDELLHATSGRDDRSTHATEQSDVEPRTRDARHMTPSLVSIVMPVRNGGPFFQEQLDALARQRLDVPFEVVISDNGSTDDTVEIAQRNADRFPALRVIDSSDRAGAAHARNRGVSAARGDLIVFCDCDDIADDDWLASLVQAAQTADVVAGYLELRVINPPLALEQRGTLHLDEAEAAGHAPVALRFLPYAVSANMAIWRDVIDAIGEWDERYRTYMEDVEYSWRAQLHGFTLRYAQDAMVHYRLRGNLRAILKQTFKSAANEPLIAAVYRDAGVVSPVAEIPGRIHWLLLRIGNLAGGTTRRSLWLRRLVTVSGFAFGWFRARRRIHEFQGGGPADAGSPPCH